MITETEYHIARERFEQAAKDCGFVFHSPFDMTDTLSAFGYIEGYGSKNGTVVCLISSSDPSIDQKVIEWSRQMECFCSFIFIEPLLGEYKPSYFREMLRDWGKF
ncbi:MAG: hypothetical protein IJ357_00510 [Oscillospiraceae bacterium]|nr:hypothetical protein [Oscillospiraceae bacterium]